MSDDQRRAEANTRDLHDARAAGAEIRRRIRRIDDLCTRHAIAGKDTVGYELYVPVREVQQILNGGAP